MFCYILKRDITLAFTNPGDLISLLTYFIIIPVLFPLSIGPHPDQLQLLAPGIIWVAALLVSALALPRMFEEDYEDGTLQLFLTLPAPLHLIVLAKICAHWCTTGAALLLATPLLALFMGLPFAVFGTLLIAFLLGTLLLTLIGAMGAALVLGLKRGGVLLSLLVLPLYIPVLIFATSAILFPEKALANLIILASMAFIMLPITTFATTASLRIAVEEQ